MIECFDSQYKCDQGRLHIIVYNYTYLCAKEGQVVRIHRNRNGTLHNGGILCPKCSHFCDVCINSLMARLIGLVLIGFCFLTEL